ncbi:hypothetical protein LCGC14_1894670 [marine sediment metagenome]|uniref:Uncharacterized protein n=1 Tax=marine sediment metagenome TaxID=412755 RepID=A0A0F9GLS1_9ZZZZ
MVKNRLCGSSAPLTYEELSEKEGNLQLKERDPIKEGTLILCKACGFPGGTLAKSRDNRYFHIPDCPPITETTSHIAQPFKNIKLPPMFKWLKRNNK